MGRGAPQDITLHLQRGDRIGVRGRNGSGKSTLLRVLAGELQPLRGEVKRAATTALLDQSLSSLPAQDSALQLLQRANPMASDGTLRTSWPCSARMPSAACVRWAP